MEKPDISDGSKQIGNDASSEEMRDDLFLIRTRGDAPANDKRKVLFVCHSRDFSACYEEIVNDILLTYDCAVFCPKDQEQPLANDPEDEMLLLFGFNLIVIPVSRRLLDPSAQNRAMYYFRKIRGQRPVLPLLLEQIPEYLYADEDNFGARQYLEFYKKDINATGVPYHKKLAVFLNSVLGDADMQKKIRAAFTARIFLSYRKKDRQYADLLMREIHKCKDLQNIAVWYDEFLVPGEEFNKLIAEKISSSNLFILLVTPFLYEKHKDGKDNYVVSEEYPAAQTAEIPVLPVEAASADREKLISAFPKIPPCISMYDNGGLHEKILRRIKNRKTIDAEKVAENTCLIGVAYLQGIEVKINFTIGMSLIKEAAQTGFINAMRYLSEVYENGDFVPVNYDEAQYWARKYADACITEYGKSDEITKSAISRTAKICILKGDYAGAAEQLEPQVFALEENTEEEYMQRLYDISMLGVAYRHLGQRAKALEMQTRAYELALDILGADDKTTLTIQSNLGVAYGNMEKPEKALSLQEPAEEKLSKLLGEDAQETLAVRSNLALTYGKLGRYEKAIGLCNKVYKDKCRFLGETHPETLMTLHNLAQLYCEAKDFETSKKHFKNVLEQQIYWIGEDHPETMKTKYCMANLFIKTDKLNKAAKLLYGLYEKQCGILGPDHPETIETLGVMSKYAHACALKNNYEEACPIQKKIYEAYLKHYGEDSKETLTALNNYADSLFELNRISEAEPIMKSTYDKLCEKNEEPDILFAALINNLASLYIADKKPGRAFRIIKPHYQRLVDLFGEGNRYVQMLTRNFIIVYITLEKDKEVTELCSRVFENTSLDEPKLISVVAEIYEKKFRDVKKASSLRDRIKPNS